MSSVNLMGTSCTHYYLCPGVSLSKVSLTQGYLCWVSLTQGRGIFLRGISISVPIHIGVFRKGTFNKQVHIYSGGNKFVIFCFALLLLQILNNFQNQGQFWNLLVLTISKHPLHVQFDQVLAEKFEVKDTGYHSFIFSRFSLIEMKVTGLKIVLFTIKGTIINKNNF